MPRNFLNDIVLLNLAEFEKQPGDLRLAFNAVAAIDSLMAHIFFWCKENKPDEVAHLQDDSEYRHYLAGKSAGHEIGLLIDVAKSQKHFRLQRGKKSVTGADQTTVQSLGWGKARWNEGRWGSPPQVVVETDEGATRVLETILKKSLVLLEAEMERLGM